MDRERGLTADQAAARLAQAGANDVRLERPPALWRSVVAQLRETMILVLLVALGLTLTTADVADATVIALVIAVNATMGVVQERRALRAVTALRSLAAPSARVRRDGHVQSVPTTTLVPGDVLLVKEGDVVAADARLLEAHDLEVDESLLTGESTPSARRADAPLDLTTPVGDRVTMLHAGTTVTYGRGEAVVVGTGASSQVGNLAGMLASGSAPLTPLQRRLRRLGQILSVAAVVACVVVVLLGLLRGQSWETMLLTGISLAVAAIPESLPAVVTLALAGGAHRMAQRGAIVRSLPAVETLGSVTLLATDKTGTLTRGAMECVATWTPASSSSPLTRRRGSGRRRRTADLGSSVQRRTGDHSGSSGRQHGGGPRQRRPGPPHRRGGGPQELPAAARDPLHVRTTVHDHLARGRRRPRDHQGRSRGRARRARGRRDGPGGGDRSPDVGVAGPPRPRGHGRTGQSTPRHWPGCSPSPTRRAPRRGTPSWPAAGQASGRCSSLATTRERRMRLLPPWAWPGTATPARASRARTERSGRESTLPASSR